MRSHRLILSLLACALLAPAGATAFHDPAVPLVEDDSFDGGAWVAYRVVVPAGSEVHYDIETTMKDARRNATSAWLLKADGSVASYIVVTGFGAHRERHVELPGEGVIMTERSGGMKGPGGLGGGWRFNTPGEYILVHVATSDASVSSRLRLYATDGVELLAKTTGQRTFVYADSDFRGTANVIVSEPCIQNFSPLCPNVKVLTQQALTESVTHRLFGSFQSVLTQVLVSGYEGPASSRSVIGPNSTLFTNEPPGTYRFTVDAYVATHPLSALAVWGADVELP